MLRLTLIGYWDGPLTDGSWPAVEQFVDPTWDPEDRDFVIDYLRSGLVARTTMGWSRCRFCGADNGDSELSDGRYVWPDGLAHYLEAHAVRLPQEFVDHALRLTEALEQASRDTDWWRRAGVDG